MLDPRLPKRGKPVDVNGDAVYQRHRIHVAQLVSGAYVVSIVHVGTPGSGVENLRGEYRTKDDAIAAAKHHIDKVGKTSSGAET